MKPTYTLLLAIKALHDRGHEGLRVVCAPSPSGVHLRCNLSVVGETMVSVRDLRMNYSSASEWRFFANQPKPHLIEAQFEDISPELLADKIVEEFPALLEKATFSCTPYKVWYARLLDYCGENGSFIQAMEYWGTAKENGYVQVYRSSNSAQPLQFPLSPVF